MIKEDRVLLRRHTAQKQWLGLFIVPAIYVSVSQNQHQEVEVNLSESDESHDKVSLFTMGLAASHHVTLQLY